MSLDAYFYSTIEGTGHDTSMATMSDFDSSGNFPVRFERGSYSVFESTIEGIQSSLA